MFTFREANFIDAENIANLHAESWRRTYRGNFSDKYLDGDVFTERKLAWKSRLSVPRRNQYVCVAESEGAICGFLCAFGGNSPEWGSFIDNLHVDLQCQGQGVGKKLMSYASSWLSSNFPDCGVYLLVWESNPAFTFYQHLGGRNTGLIEEENPDGGKGTYYRVAWEKPDLISDTFAT